MSTLKSIIFETIPDQHLSRIVATEKYSAYRNGKSKRLKKKPRPRQRAKLKTFKEYASKVFMHTKLLTMAENGRLSYEMYFNNHINPVIGDCLMTEITPAMIESLVVGFQQTHAHASTIKLWNILNGVFKMATIDDTVKMNPMTKLERPKPKAEEQPEEESDKAYTAEELKYILKSLAKEPVKWQLYIRLMADTGLRRGECSGIQWEDINFEDNEITIRHNLQVSKEKGIYDKRPKNKKVRVVDVDPDIISDLKKYREAEAEKPKSKYVFTQENSDKPIYPTSPTKYFASFGKRYKIKDFHPHKLRHSNVSLALGEGADIPAVSQRAGHSNPAVTMRIYAHSNQKAIRKAGQKARDALKDKQKEDPKEGKQE